MNFRKYFTTHPDRLSQLDIGHSDEFYISAGADPIYVTGAGLIDILSLSAFVALHGGAKPVNELAAVQSYLHSERSLRHPLDTVEKYSEALAELKVLHKSKRKEYLKRSDRDNYRPFFLHPETAFGFVRKHLSNSPEMYGQALTVASNIIPKHASDLMKSALGQLAKDNHVAAYMAKHDLSLTLSVGVVSSEGKEPESYMEVLLRFKGLSAIHERLALPEWDLEKGLVFYTPGEILNHDQIRRHLPNNFKLEVGYGNT